MGWVEENITQPISDVAEDVLGEDTYEVIKDVGQTVAAVTTGGASLLATTEAENIFDDVQDFLDDPFGQKEPAENAQRILEQSAYEGIETLEQQQGFLTGLYQPYYEKAEEALPILQQMISGTYEGPTSKLYEYQKDMGERAIKRRRAASGSFFSSGKEEELGNFYADIAGEEAERQYGGVLSQIQLGSGALGAVQAASGNLSGNVGSIYSNLGAGSANIAGNLGQARQSLYSTLGNTLGNLSVYGMMRS